MEIRESKERADVEEVFRKRGGYKVEEKLERSIEKIRDSRTYEGKRRKHSFAKVIGLPSRIWNRRSGYPVGE